MKTVYPFKSKFMIKIFFSIILLLNLSVYNLKGQDNKVNKGEALLLIGYEKYKEGQADSSIYYYKQAVIELEKLKSKSPLIEAYANLYAINYLMGNYKMDITS